ncbi:MAG: diguanylate cyclase, partial [Spirochaetota bacterium]
MKDERSGILLVSPDQELFRNVESALGADFHVSSIISIKAAYDEITYKLPNIIICETEINGESGYDFCTAIRKGMKTKLIPFIFISSSGKLNDRIKAIQQGADAFLNRPLNIKELTAYIRSKIIQFNEFYELSVTDELTRLYNRREFLKKFSTEINENPDRIISLAILDLDFFKQVNDIHGHQTGDLVLMELAV